MTPHPLYLLFGAAAQKRLAAYAALFESHLDSAKLKAIPESLNRSAVLGTDRFVDQIKFSLARRDRPSKPGRPKKRE